MVLDNDYAMDLPLEECQDTCSAQRTHTWESNKMERICEYIRNLTEWVTCNRVHLQTRRLRNVQIQHPQ